MDDRRQSWRVSSGMFARQTGTYRAQQMPVVRQAQSYSSGTDQCDVSDFQETRNLIFLACTKAYRFQQPISLLVLAIDELTNFEYHYGPDAAQSATAFIERSLCHYRKLIFGSRSEVVIGRYVENRYLILLPTVNCAAASEHAEFLRKSIVDAEFKWNFQDLHLTVSIGIAHKPGHAGDQDMLILQADSACDQVIACGGNRVNVAKITESF